jgi:SAM-dependent methyltransferase
VAKNETSKKLFETYLEQAQSTQFTGWNFEYVTKAGRMVEAPVKWNYYNIVLPYLLRAGTMLDMGTGGGEVLSRFQPLPPLTYATEQYQPNIAVARERLEPLGVKVFEIEEEKEPPFNTSLPFDDGFFDLVISRHEAYYPQELLRILKPEGMFITQQVGNIGLINLKQFLSGKPEIDTNWNLKSAVEELESVGFQILEQKEDIQFYRFYDIGAVAYFMKAIPWIIEDFTIDKYRDRLWELHLWICHDGFYDSPLHLFIIVSQKDSTV